MGFFAMLLSLLGIGSSCSEIEDIFGPRLMYGSPTARYSVKGTVTDEAGTPVPGIKVVVSGVYSFNDDNNVLVRDYFQLADTLSTDGSGNYSIQDRSSIPYNEILIRTFDTDGDLNGGTFAPDSASVTNINFVKDKDDKSEWYCGKADVNVPVIRLKKK